jgi:serine-type D-Ala-D-Ala endopeptidase (penicillin-binding protein 7)
VRNAVLSVALALALAFAGMVSAAEPAKKPAKTVAKGKPAAASKRVAVTYPGNGGKAVVGAAATAAAVQAGAQSKAGQHGLDLKSSSALVLDAAEGKTLYAKNTGQVSAIASITKLMTAIVVLDAGLPLDESIRIDRADIDTLKHTGSRLRIGSAFARRDLLHLALMSSENRAASALGRAYPGGSDAFVARMNARAFELGMVNSRFVEPTGLSSENVSTADDLALLVRASLDYPLIREFTTAPSAQVHTADTGQVYGFSNSNGLVRTPAWQIEVSKTGYIAEAGQCLVMQARINERPIIIVLLDSWGKYTRIGDANRIKKWLESRAVALGQAS